MIEVGTRVCLEVGRRAVVEGLTDRGVIELATPSGGSLCFSHTDCVQIRTEQVQTDFWPELTHPSMVTLARLRGAAADARSAREDAAAAPRCSALGIYGENAVTLSKKGRA